FLLIERLLVLLDSGVITRMLRKSFAASNDGANAKLQIGFQDRVMRIEGDAAWLGPAENFGGKAGIGAANFDGLELGIPFGLDLNLHGHAEKVEILFHPAIEAEAGLGS